MMGKTAGLVAAAVAALLAGGVPSSDGAYPGASGRIVFQRGYAYDGATANL